MQTLTHTHTTYCRRPPLHGFLIIIVGLGFLVSLVTVSRITNCLNDQAKSQVVALTGLRDFPLTVVRSDVDVVTDPHRFHVLEIRTGSQALS